jgi:hypothetical protein
MFTALASLTAFTVNIAASTTSIIFYNKNATRSTTDISTVHLPSYFCKVISGKFFSDYDNTE